MAALDEYLTARATQDIKRRAANCFVALDDEGRIAGYYTLAATSINLTDIAQAEVKKLPRYPLVPAALVGRLAIDENFQGKKLGAALLIDAAARACKSDAAIYALIVDAKGATARAFYAHLGFTHFASKPMSFYMPLATLLKAVDK